MQFNTADFLTTHRGVQHYKTLFGVKVPSATSSLTELLFNQNTIGNIEDS